LTSLLKKNRSTALMIGTESSGEFVSTVVYLLLNIYD
jgi:hypothetical protein